MKPIQSAIKMLFLLRYKKPQDVFAFSHQTAIPDFHALKDALKVGSKILWPLLGVKANWGFCFSVATSRACPNPSSVMFPSLKKQ